MAWARSCCDKSVLNMELSDTAAPAGYTAFVIDDTPAPAAAPTHEGYTAITAPTQADLEAVRVRQEEVAARRSRC